MLLPAETAEEVIEVQSLHSVLYNSHRPTQCKVSSRVAYFIYFGYKKKPYNWIILELKLKKPFCSTAGSILSETRISSALCFDWSTISHHKLLRECERRNVTLIKV